MGFIRSISNILLDDLENKIVILSGPRQVGKTTLGKQLATEKSLYLNYDSAEDRKMLLGQSWSRNVDFLIFDEVHKMKKFKSWLKGIYDKEGIPPKILVTGSARLDTYKKAGDSLAGRHFSYRLHPFSLAELKSKSPQKDLLKLMTLGGFPEPFLKGKEDWARRWRLSHLDRIIKDDLWSLELIKDLRSVETLVHLLSERVGSAISYSSLARDLQVSPHTVKKWIEILESLFIIFTVRPYTKSVAKSILKEPKIYFYDTGRVIGNDGQKLENCIACALLKRQNFLTDTRGLHAELYYIRDKEKREVDFLTLTDHQPEFLIESKWSDDQPAPSLKYFSNKFSQTKSFQLVGNIKRPKTYGSIDIVSAAAWLVKLES